MLGLEEVPTFDEADVILCRDMDSFGQSVADRKPTLILSNPTPMPVGGSSAINSGVVFTAGQFFGQLEAATAAH